MISGDRTVLPPAAIGDVPDLYPSIEGGGGKTSVLQEDAARDAVTAAHQRLHFLFVGVHFRHFLLLFHLNALDN